MPPVGEAAQPEAGSLVVRGARGNAGEIGHIVIDPSGPRCACGCHGDIESYLGGEALMRRAQRAQRA